MCNQSLIKPTYFKSISHLYISSHLSDYFGRNGGFTDSRLAPAFDPVDGSRFLVGAVVSTHGHHLQLWEVLLQSAQSLLCALEVEAQGRS